MTISVGDRIPEAQLMILGDDGPEEVSLYDKIQGQNVVIFGVPGAFTPTCTHSHFPSFIDNHKALRAKGVSKVICIAANDPFVLNAWALSLKSEEKNLLILGDPDGEFIAKIGMEFSAPQAGLYKRSKRFSMYAVNGQVKIINIESEPGVCELTSAETLLNQIH
ncbi:MAG: peroxiredoxin [Rhodobacteraceae bacterium]|nr:peroxiredoxin [Paracoccaceae bacterium]